MSKKNVLRHFVQCLCITAGFWGLNGCGEKESKQLYPPIVYKAPVGELGGGPINDNLTVKTVEMLNGKPIPGAKVLIHANENLELLAEADTGPDGTVSFAGKGISGPVTLTVACNQTIAYDTVSFVGINTANMVIPLERRKSPEKIKTALTFLGLDSGDAKLTTSRNDIPFPEKEVKSGKLEDDPWVLTVEEQPIAFSTLVTDAGGNTTKFGFTVEPDGPIPVETPAMIYLERVSNDNVKQCRGKIENPPANLESPADGWDPYTRYIFQVYSDGGLAGDVVAGFANLDNSYSYQAFIVKTQGLDNQRMEVSAFNRRDAWSEMSTSIAHFTFDSAPATSDFLFLGAPKNLQIEKLEGSPLPRLLWSSPGGNFTQVEIYHADYNFRWTLYVAGENIAQLDLPPLLPGSAGSLIAGEIYRFRVVSWQIPGFDYNQWSFGQIANKVTQRSRSSMTQFMVAVEPPGTPIGQR